MGCGRRPDFPGAGRSSLSTTNSQDGTAAAVERFSAQDSRVRLASAGALPDGWVGKPHACWRGALLAECDWLCFVDADVRAAPQLVAAAVTAAEAQGIDMLSLQPLQELGSFWERTIMPAGLLVLACAKSLNAGAEDAVNGQFLLIRRTAYFQVGGHSAVRAEIAEDKALAARVKEAGFDFRVLAAERLARTRMYRNFASLWEGLSKNATEVLGGPSRHIGCRGSCVRFRLDVVVGAARDHYCRARASPRRPLLVALLSPCSARLWSSASSARPRGISVSPPLSA